MEKQYKVGIVGATGMVGQRFVTLLENHPWFEVTTIAASPRSAGKTYEEAVGDRWKMDTPMPEKVKKIVVMNVNEVEKVASEVDFVFSAVDMTKEEIKKIEEDYAKTETPVVSNNSAHRWTPDVPMVVPEINPEHMKVIEFQKKRLGTTRGFVAVKPNCSIQSYAPCLAAWKEFGPKELVVTTYQAISGAGKTFKDWPEMVGNIIPYIGGEEEKSEQEPLKLWGRVENGRIENRVHEITSESFVQASLLENAFLCADLQIFCVNRNNGGFATGGVAIFGMRTICTDKDKTILFQQLYDLLGRHWHWTSPLFCSSFIIYVLYVCVKRDICQNVRRFFVQRSAVDWKGERRRRECV